MEENSPKLIDINDNSIIPINSPMFSLGRSLTCNHVVESMSVSRIHCFIQKNDKKFTLIDRSTNGTLVNGHLIKFNASIDLNHGDLIKFGTIIYEFRDDHNDQNNCDNRTTTTMNINEIGENQPTTSKINDKNNDEIPSDNKIPEIDNESTQKSTDTPPNIVEIANVELLPVAEEFEIPFETNSITNNDNNSDKNTDIDDDNRVVESKIDNIEPQLNKSMENTMDTELTCSICSELFIKAVTLTCSHTFCKFCISEWQKNRKQCPICRQSITTITPTIVLDNLIEHIITKRPQEERESREQQIKFREEKLSEAGPSNNQRKRRRNQTNRTNERRSQRPRRNNQTDGPVATSSSTITTSNGTVIHNHIIHIVSDDDGDYDEDDDDNDESLLDTFDDFLYGDSNDDDDFDDDDDDDFDGTYTGLPGHYYGGYGRCYICGDHGHWANGCPLKRRY